MLKQMSISAHERGLIGAPVVLIVENRPHRDQSDRVLRPRDYFDAWPTGQLLEGLDVPPEEKLRAKEYGAIIRGIAARLDDRPQAHTRLAARLGVHRNTIGNALHGNRFVGADVLVGLAREVGLALALTEDGEALEMTELDRRRQRQGRLDAAASETRAIQDARIEAIQRRLEEDSGLAGEIFRWLGPKIRGWADEQ